jgi:outer membrane receptor protein involved in Fe transport
MLRLVVYILLVAEFIVDATVCFAHPPEENDFALALGGEEFVSIATGHPQKINDAPAVATIINAEDIKAIGARQLSEVLESVPGLHVSVSPVSYNLLYQIRGIHSTFNPHVLLMIDGVPQTNLWFGNRGQAWGDMPVENISRIEIIRGPGSAVYGADAYAGVINIITKTDVSGVETGIGYGSFNTRNLWMLTGTRLGKYHVSASLESYTTDGQHKVIESDAQTQLDEVFGSNASIAPGPVNTQTKELDVSLQLSSENWQWRVGYHGRRDRGTGAGGAEALDPKGRNDSDRFNIDALFHDPNFGTFWDVSLLASYLDVSHRYDLYLFPPDAFGGAYPNGMIGNPDVYERHLRLGLSAFYTGLQRHTLRLGSGLYFGDMYKIKESKNFDKNNSPIGEVKDVSDTADVFAPEKTRSVFYGYVQDEWDFISNWRLTSGIRWDNYSDFGTTINPRLALVWQAKHDITTKLLYGRAFRPPSFAESFLVNNPVTLGNSNLQPETIDTLEWVLDYRPSQHINTNLNIYYYKMRDIIQFVPDPSPATTFTAQNLGEQTGYGFEWEAQWKPFNTFEITGNYALQFAHDEQTGKDAGHAPQQQLYLRSDWRFAQNWRTTAQLNWVADRKRVAEDSRPPVDDYTTFDLSLRWQTNLRDWEVALIGKNIFDADVREPSPAPGRIPNDLPLAGRSLFLEVRYAP